MVGLSASVIAAGYGVGAALLALWLFISYPNQGPQTFRTAGAVVFSSCGLLFLTGPTTAAVEALAGSVVALLATFLPLLMFAFWSTLHLLRVMFITAGGRFSA